MKAGQNCELALGFLYIYDYTITLDKEVELIWGKTMSVTNILFALNRYVPMIAVGVNIWMFHHEGPNLSAAVRGHWFKFQIGQTISLPIIQAILVVRIWAMYHKNMNLLVVLAIFGILQLGATWTIIAISIAYLKPSTTPGCEGNLYFAAYWISIVPFQLSLCILTAIKAVKAFRFQRIGFSSVLGAISGQALLTILVQASGIYFVLIALVYALNAVSWYWADAVLYEMASMFGIVMPPIIVNKLFFSLRRRLEPQSRHGTSSDDSLELTEFNATTPGTNTDLDVREPMPTSQSGSDRDASASRGI
ncbi:hypothetical protein C8J56DRAFT_383589 [Mycena floridula]|nr:hypothetical protein C8J56DRAFT_383589 [Mycena floridula]